MLQWQALNPSVFSVFPKSSKDKDDGIVALFGAYAHIVGKSLPNPLGFPGETPPASRGQEFFFLTHDASPSSSREKLLLLRPPGPLLRLDAASPLLRLRRHCRTSLLKISGPAAAVAMKAINKQLDL
uniref:Uncharacterized protein n=1 Tax=Leersia perrieri TaxID=77586 RepID=A0A0D9XBZ0_9ORYZ